jgi:hypothetical protein
MARAIEARFRLAAGAASAQVDPELKVYWEKVHHALVPQPRAAETAASAAPQLHGRRWLQCCGPGTECRARRRVGGPLLKSSGTHASVKISWHTCEHQGRWHPRDH